MADDVDYSSDMEMTFREQAIAANSKPMQPLKYMGYCYNCESEIKHGAFCSLECSKEYEWYENRKKGYTVFKGAA